MAGPTTVAVAMISATGILAGCAAWIDARTHRLPNALVLACYPVVLAGLGGLAWLGHPAWTRALVGALAWGVPIGLLWLLGGPRGMGPGDVKIALPLGATLGVLSPGIAAFGVALAFVAGGIVALAQAARRRAAVRIAFGPYLVVGWTLGLVGALAAALSS